MNPNAAAFAMILKQREAMAKSNQVLLPVNKQNAATQQFHRTSQPPQPPQPPHIQSHSPYHNHSVQPYMIPNRYQPPHPPGTSSFASNLSAYAAHHHTQQCYPGSSATPGLQGYNNTNFIHNLCAGYGSQPNYRQNQQQQQQHFQQRPPTPPAEPDAQYFCEPCDKEFSQIGAFEAHKATHETCKHPGCEFSATKKVVIAHYHGAHGQFSGSGYKMIDVEGQKFRVLMGQSPEEIAEWRASRRKKFPTAEAAELRQQHLAEVAAAGGIVPTASRSKQLTKRPISSCTQETGNENSEPLCKQARSEDTALNNATERASTEEDAGAAGEERKRCFQYGRGRCKAGDACPFSHAIEPKQCDYFVRGFCKRGPKCFNIHDPAQRAEYRAKNPTEKKVEKDSGDKKDKEHRFGQLNSNGELSIPAPLAGGQRGTLWRKLLEDQVAEEENIVLQCLRFLVQNNFLEKSATEPAVAPSTTTEPAVASSTATEPAVASSTATEPAVAPSTTTEPAVASSTTTEPAVASSTATEPAVVPL